MKKLKIGEKEYTLEFTFEASLYDECTEKVMLLMTNIGEAQETEEVKQMITSVATIPQTTLTLFYAGLLENHGAEVRSKDDAKALLKQYFADNKENNFYGLLSLLIETMRADGFFDRIGMTEIAEVPKRTKKAIPAPQHGKM